MNIIEAVSIADHSPSKIAEKLKSFIFGFKNRRDVTYFDLFLLYPLYSYKPAYEYFDKNMSLKDKMNFFTTHSSTHPEVFINVQADFINTLSVMKEGILYATNNDYFEIDNNLIVHLTKKTLSNKDRVAENIGKFCSTKKTSYLYNFFKVDIDAI